MSGRMKDVSLGDSDSSSLFWKHTPQGLLMEGRASLAPLDPCVLRDIVTLFPPPPDTGGGQPQAWSNRLSYFVLEMGLILDFLA